VVGQPRHAGLEEARGVTLRAVPAVPAGLAALALAGAACAGLGDCRGLEGEYAYTGVATADSVARGLAPEPNIVLILHSDAELAYDGRIERYRIVLDGERFMLELYTAQGPLARLAMASETAEVDCRDGVLTIARPRQTRAGSVYEYSRHQHRLHRDGQGGLAVETEISGSYHTWLMTWPRPHERHGVRFAQAGRR